MDYNYNITRQESSAIKGFTMCLIVFGHLLRVPIFGFSADAFNYLYSFHVVIFFILPFLYASSSFSWNNVKKYFKKLYVPYIVFFSLLTILALVLSKVGINLFDAKPDYVPKKSVVGFCQTLIVGGDKRAISYYCGLEYLWFLPMMFSTLIWKDVYYSVSRGWRMVLLLLGLISFVVFWVRIVPLSDAYQVAQFSPAASIQALGMCACAVCVAYLVRGNRTISYVVLTFFSIAFYLLLKYLAAGGANVRMGLVLLKIVNPIIWFGLLYNMRRLINISLFRAIGKYSLQIYLLHPILCAVRRVALSKIGMEYAANIWVLMLSFIVILAVTYYMVIIIEKIPLVKYILFPKK